MSAKGRPEMPYGWGRVPYSHADRLPWRNLPFPEEEYEQRIARLRTAMAEHGLDCLVVWGDRGDMSNVRYLTNFEDFYGGQTVVVIPAAGELGMTTNAIMHGEPMHSGIQDAWPRDVRCAAAPRTVNAVEAVTIFDHVEDFLAEAGAMDTIGVVGAGEPLREFLARTRPRATVRPADDLLVAMRAIKSEREVEALRKACHLADQGLVAAMGAVRPGATEFDISAAANQAMFAAGAEAPAFPIAVGAGARSGFKHMAPTANRIEKGDVVYIDLGGRYMGYYSDCSRQTVCGDPDPEQRRFMETQITIVEEVVKRARPGAVIGELAKVGEAIATDAGYAEHLYFRGHGIGCATHDKPSISPANPAPLEKDMVFCFEPMLVKFGYGTACWEDIWHVTDDGVTRLNQAPYRFW
jgi:Xaa-Pro aminopeptidase